MSIRLEEVNCLICNSHDNDILYDAVPDRFSPDKRFTEVKCRNCGFVFLSPRPMEEEMAEFYDLEEYQPHNLSKTSLFDRLYRKIRIKNSINKRKLIEKHLNTGNLLDIGCGTGDFLSEMKAHNWFVSGMETAPDARKIAEDKDIKIADELWKVEKSFDVITMWHVLEHVHRVENMFDNIKRLLKPEGYLIIAVPNIESLDARFYKYNWVALDAPRHLYHFRPRDISDLLTKPIMI